MKDVILVSVGPIKSKWQSSSSNKLVSKFSRLRYILLCEILLVEAKKVLLNIIVIRKNLICIYFQHSFTFATTKLVSSIDLVLIPVFFLDLNRFSRLIRFASFPLSLERATVELKLARIMLKRLEMLRTLHTIKDKEAR